MDVATVVLVLFAGQQKTILHIAVGNDRRSKALVEQWGRIKDHPSHKQKVWLKLWAKQIRFVRDHYELRFEDLPTVTRTPAYHFGYDDRWFRIKGTCTLAIPTIAQIVANHWCKIHHSEEFALRVQKGGKSVEAYKREPKYIDMRWPAGRHVPEPYPVLAKRP